MQVSSEQGGEGLEKADLLHDLSSVAMGAGSMTQASLHLCIREIQEPVKLLEAIIQD